MPVEFYFGDEFKTEHEAEDQNSIVELLKERFDGTDGLVAALFNFHCNGKDIDLSIIKRNGIIVADMKRGSTPINPINGSEYDRWTWGDGNEVKAGGQYINPFEQIRQYRIAFKAYLKDHRFDFMSSAQKASQSSFDHVTGLIVVSPDLHKESRIDVNFGINRWFGIIGLPQLPSKTITVRSPEIDLKDDEIRELVKALNCRPLTTSVTAPAPPTPPSPLSPPPPPPTDLFDTIYGFFKACDKEKLRLELKAKSGFISIKDGTGRTLLHKAAEDGHAELAEALLEIRPEFVNVKDQVGETPLHKATFNGHHRAVMILISYGSDIPARNNSGKTAEDFAVSKKLLEIANYLELLRKQNEREDAPEVDEDESTKPLPILTEAEMAERLDAMTKELAAKHDPLAGINDDPLAGINDDSLVNNSLDTMVPRIECHDTPQDNDVDGIPIIEAIRRLGSGLHVAVKEGDGDAVITMLKKYPDLLDMQFEYRTPLYTAVENGHRNIVELLLEHGASLEADRDKSPLHAAAEKGYKDIVELLLDKDADIEASDAIEHDTPLTYAVSNGHYDTAELLLNRGADPNDSLVQAIIEDDLYMVKLLVNHGAIIDEEHIEIYAGEEIADFLKDAFEKQEANKVYLSDVNPLAGMHEDPLAGMHDTLLNSKIVHTAANPLLDVHPLFDAVRYGDYEGVEDLLSNNPALVNVCDGSQLTPLHWAAKKGHIEIARLLLKYRSDVDAEDIYGWTPLHKAARWGRKTIAELLLRKGANVNARANNGSTPLDKAIRYERRQTENLLRQYGGVL
ncbi:MAG: ankyrin repeat domain-containing protein [Nitrospirota bacterium]